jgi:hypothetical protein
MVVTSDSAAQVPLPSLCQALEGYQVSWGYRLEVIWFCMYTNMMDEAGSKLEEPS